jgi:hypothetical protein
MKGLVEEAEETRQKFKAVWRARPGRPTRDFAARARREEQRRANKGFFRGPGI